MKKKSLIPQYLQDELSNLVQKKDAYTEEDIDQLSRDYDYVLKQREQLKEAEKYGAIKAVHHTGNHKRCHALLGTREGKTQ